MSLSSERMCKTRHASQISYTRTCIKRRRRRRRFDPRCRPLSGRKFSCPVEYQLQLSTSCVSCIINITSRLSSVTNSSSSMSKIKKVCTHNTLCATYELERYISDIGAYAYHRRSKIKVVRLLIVIRANSRRKLHFVRLQI